MTRKPPQVLRSDRTDDYYNYRLHNARLAAGCTQAQLGEKVGIPFQTVQGYERLYSTPSPAIAQRIADALNRKADEIFPPYLHRLAAEINREREHREPKHKYIPLSNVPKERFAVYDDPLMTVTKKALCETLESTLNTLPLQHREIIKLRFGFANGVSFTLEEIGRVYRRGRARIHQIESGALKRLQHPMRAQKLEAFLDNL